MKDCLIQARYSFIEDAYTGIKLLNVEAKKGGISERYQIVHKLSNTALVPVLIGINGAARVRGAFFPDGEKLRKISAV